MVRQLALRWPTFSPGGLNCWWYSTTHEALPRPPADHPDVPLRDRGPLLRSQAVGEWAEKVWPRLSGATKEG